MDSNGDGEDRMSGLRRFFTDKIEEFTEITGDEYSHAINTLRCGVGDEIILCDNSGWDHICEIIEVKKKSFVAKSKEKRFNDTETSSEVTLVCGYLKGDKTEYVVQKAVELGVKKIIVFSSEFSSAYMNDNKLARLNKVSVEAAKQCGRSIAPKVIYKENFSSAIDCVKNCKNRLFFYENKTNYATHICSVKGDCAVVIGSEGGFSEAEAALAASEGFVTVSLGKRILRADTASVCALSLVMYELGELE
ncbi:MAG: 16S rRNA (uracil(1498)-N(3))-methyltransferase [Clostridia bacterium]|nr:16S rRNA (uracil(1498)-N(3))-methyltransferase [Clostridia bacterium]